MFFTKAGFVIAWLLFVPSAIAFGLVLGFLWSGNAAKAVELFGDRFLASHGTFIQGMALGIAFGIAAEISSSLAGRQ